MNAAKHTPGPWEADTADIGFAGGGERDVCPTKRRGRSPNGGFIIARLSGPDRAANARLIAAAPELYQALRDAVAALGGIESDNVPQTVRGALSKATGSAS